MQLTKASDYAIRGMIAMAKRPTGTISLVRDIADEENISREFLAKIFQHLVRAGLVRSYRGNKGGFILARPAHQVTLRDVVEAVSGPMNILKSVEMGSDSANLFSRPVYKIWHEAQNKFLAVLDAATIASLVTSEHYSNTAV